MEKATYGGKPEERMQEDARGVAHEAKQAAEERRDMAMRQAEDQKRRAASRRACSQSGRCVRACSSALI